MHLLKLAISALAITTATFLATRFVLRESPSPVAALAPPDVAANRGPTGAPSPPAKPTEKASKHGTTDDEARFVAEVARSADAQERTLRESITRIGEDEALALDARLERYRDAVRSAQERDPSAPILSQRSMLAEVFLRMPGVQRELSEMSPSARNRALHHIRRELGFDEQEVARMEEIDRRHEERWQNGLAYMRERSRIASTFEGEALEAELRALREEYFAHEASTLEAEERGGFFRFERPRIYGRN